MNLCHITHWRHGSTAPPRALTPDEKRERLAELRASHVRVMLGRALHAGALAVGEFYRSLLDGAEPLPLPQPALKCNDTSDFDHGPMFVAEDVRVTDETEASRA